MVVIDIAAGSRRAMLPTPMPADNNRVTLLERESALSLLAESAAAARASAGQFVLVAGEAGIGKSALIEQFERSLPDAQWWWGACDGLFTPRPLAPLFDIADQLGGELLGLCRDGGDREAMFRALLRQLSSSATVNVVVVEDIHWADEATLDLLKFIGRRIRTAPVLVIATYRDEGPAAADAFRRALGELVSAGLTSRIELEPLSMDAVEDLVGRTSARYSALEAAELYRLTGGNPFYVAEVLRAGVDQVPTSARDIILARAAALTPESREALEAAALTGSRIETALLERIVAVSASVLDELVGSGLLVGDGSKLHFRHEIARLALEQEVPSHRRSAIHRRILAALRETSCDDDARLAFHAESAGDSAAVLEYGPRAATRAVALSSHPEAVAQYQRTLRFAAGLSPAAIAQLYDQLVDELALVNRWPEAAEAGERSLELWRAVGNQLREGDTLRRLSRTMWRLCRGREANSYGEAAVEILEPLGVSAELAWAYAGLARQRMVQSSDADAIRLARLARDVAEPLGEHAVMSDAFITEGCASSYEGTSWSQPLERALDIAMTHGIDEQAGRAFANLHAMYCGQFRFEEAERFFLAGIAYTDEHEMTTFGDCLRSGRVIALMLTGSWDEAEASAGQLIDSSGGSTINQLTPLGCLALIRVRRGQLDAVDMLDQVVVTAEGTAEPQQILPARLARAEAHWLAGNPELARREVELADDVSADCDDWQRGEIAVWLRRTGSTRAPRGTLAEPYRAQVAGDWQSAAAAWVALGCAYDAAMALADSSDEAALREALKGFDALGAAAPAQLTRRKLRALGAKSVPVGRRSSTRAHPLGLTERECDVLQLICNGDTNAEIAAELVISPRTVDHHVSAILAKLGAPSRNAAAAHAAQLGLVAS